MRYRQKSALYSKNDNKIELYYFNSFFTLFVNNFLSTGFFNICSLDKPGTIINNSSDISKAVTKRSLIVGSIDFIC